MGMKNSLGLLTMLMMSGAINPHEEYHASKKKILDDKDIENDFLIKPKKVTAKGLKAFEFPRGTIYAINQKNANKKYQKLLKK